MKMEDTIKSIEETTEQIFESIGELKKRNNTLKLKNDSLRTRNEFLENQHQQDCIRINDLTTTINTLTRMYAQLRQHVGID